MALNKAKIITVTSVKGGSGKTTTVLNLAGILSEMQQKTIIVDLDLYSGSIAASLNINGETDIYTLCEDMMNNRFEQLSDYTQKYNEYIDVLSAPIDPRSVSKIKAKFMEILISRLTLIYDVILIDTSHNLSPVSLTAIDKSDNTLFMVTNDPVDLKNARSMIAIFEDTENDNYKVVFNSSKDTGKDYFSLFDVKNIIKHNIDYTIDHSFYIKDIDKYVIDGEILTLNKKIRSSKKNDIIKLTKLATALLNSKEPNKEVRKDG